MLHDRNRGQLYYNKGGVKMTLSRFVRCDDNTIKGHTYPETIIQNFYCVGWKKYKS